MCLHPFIITDGNSENRHANLEVTRLYGYLTARDASISLADLEALQAKEVRYVPFTYWELETHLGSFGNLLRVVLGMTHPLSQAYSNMWQLLKSGLWDELHTTIKYRAYVKPMPILQSIQLGFYTWFPHCRSRLTPPQPDFVSILNQVLLQVYVLSRLPTTLYHLAYPKKSATDGSSLSLPDLMPQGLHRAAPVAPVAPVEPTVTPPPPSPVSQESLRRADSRPQGDNAPLWQT
jgi:hypothetical protein